MASPAYSPYVSPTYSPLTRSLQAITPKDAVILNEKIGNYVNFKCLTKKSHRQPKGSVTEDQISPKARTSEAEPRTLKSESEFNINFVNNQFVCTLIHVIYAYL